jgi:hypothetical protein
MSILHVKEKCETGILYFLACTTQSFNDTALLEQNTDLYQVSHTKLFSSGKPIMMTCPIYF